MTLIQGGGWWQWWAPSWYGFGFDGIHREPSWFFLLMRSQSCVIAGPGRPVRVAHEANERATQPAECAVFLSLLTPLGAPQRNGGWSRRTLKRARGPIWHIWWINLINQPIDQHIQQVLTDHLPSRGSSSQCLLLLRGPFPLL